MGIKDAFQKFKEQFIQDAPPEIEESLEVIQEQAPIGVSFVKTKQGRLVLCIIVDDGNVKDGYVDVLKVGANQTSANMLAQQIYHEMQNHPDHPFTPRVLELHKQLRTRWIDTKTTLHNLGIASRRD